MVLLRKVSSALVQHSFWAYATSPSVYVARTCNDLNFQPNGAPWATGSGPSCYANQPTGKIYDMSGVRFASTGLFSGLAHLGGCTMTPSGERRVRLFKIGTATVFMLDAIRRFFGDFRPADLTIVVIELVFVVIVSAEWATREIRDCRKRRRQRRRQQEIDLRVRALRDALWKGQELQLRTPGSGDPYVAAWRQAVSNWGEETRVLLKSFSEHAETAFSLPMPSLPYITGSVGAVSEFVSLISHLNNLRGIIEKPDVYL